MTKQRSKAYQAKKESYSPEEIYSPKEAMELARKTATTKFKGSVEAHLTLLEKDVKATVKLPHGTGKALRILVLATGDAAKKAESAGADFVGGEDLITKIADGWLGFDALIASPEMMPKLAKLGKVLGPRGLMPNPKNGTVTNDPTDTIAGIKGGEVTLKSDMAQPTLHTLIGKSDFSADKLVENFEAVVRGVGKIKIKKASVNSTMGPSIKIDLSSL